ncbi:MAG: hypothetical protein V3S69_00040 [Dehalococcoidales bacterium]
MITPETLLLADYEFLGVEVDLRISFNIEQITEEDVQYYVLKLELVREELDDLDISLLLTPAIRKACVDEVVFAMNSYHDNNNIGK